MSEKTSNRGLSFRDSQWPALAGVIRGALGASFSRSTFFGTCRVFRGVRFSGVDFARHPHVKLPCPASDITGRWIDFIPIHDGIDEAVPGRAHVLFLDGCPMWMQSSGIKSIHTCGGTPLGRWTCPS
jgi:hypothetical protein